MDRLYVQIEAPIVEDVECVFEEIFCGTYGNVNGGAIFLLPNLLKTFHFLLEIQSVTRIVGRTIDRTEVGEIAAQRIALDFKKELSANVFTRCAGRVHIIDA